MRPFLTAAVLSAGIALALPSVAQDAFLASKDPPRPEAQSALARFRTVLVGPIPGDAIASGMQLLNALASINPTSCPGDNWRLWIAPGVYDLAGSSLMMKPCVDIEGAGERATTITASGGSFDCSAATVFGATNTELRMLAIESIHSCAFGAVGARLKLAQVTLSSAGTFGAGLTIDASSVTLTDVTITASGGYGIAADALSSLTIYRSRVAGPHGAIYINVPGVARVAHSQIDGSLSPGIACIGNYDANLAPVTCP